MKSWRRQKEEEESLDALPTTHSEEEREKEREKEEEEAEKCEREKQICSFSGKSFVGVLVEADVKSLVAVDLQVNLHACQRLKLLSSYQHRGRK